MLGIRIKFPFIKGKRREKAQKNTDNFYFDPWEHFTDQEIKSMLHWGYVFEFNPNCFRSNFNVLHYYRVKGERGLIKSK